MLVVDPVELTDLAAGQVLVVGQGWAHRVSLMAASSDAVLGSIA